MPTLKELVNGKRRSEKTSFEKMSRIVDISRNQFVTVMNAGFSDGTTLKTIRGFARLLGMAAWELLKILETQE